MAITVIPLLTETGSFVPLDSPDSYFLISGSFVPTSPDSMICVMVGITIPNYTDADNYYSGIYLNSATLNNREIMSDGGVVMMLPDISGSLIYDTQTYMRATLETDIQTFDLLASYIPNAEYALCVFELVPSLGKYVNYDGVLTSAQVIEQTEDLDSTIVTITDSYIANNKLVFGVVSSALHSTNEPSSGSGTICSNVEISSASALWSVGCEYGSNDTSIDFSLTDYGFSSSLFYSLVETDYPDILTLFPNDSTILLAMSQATSASTLSGQITIVDENSAILAFARHYSADTLPYTNDFFVSVGGSSLSMIQLIKIRNSESEEPTGSINFMGMGNRHGTGTFDFTCDFNATGSSTTAAGIYFVEVIPTSGSAYDDSSYIRNSFTEQRYNQESTYGSMGTSQTGDMLVGIQITNEYCYPYPVMSVTDQSAIRMLYDSEDGYTSSMIFSMRNETQNKFPYPTAPLGFNGVVVSGFLYETELATGSPSVSPSASPSASPSPSLQPVIDSWGSATWYYQNKILDKLFGSIDFEAPDIWYLGLSSSQPYEDGSGVTEVSTSGTGYSRIQEPNVPWHFGYKVYPQKASYYLTRNYYSYEFPVATANWGNIRYLCFYDQPTGGNLWFWCYIGEREVLNGLKLLIAPGHVDISSVRHPSLMSYGGFGSYFANEKILDKAFGKTDFTPPASWWIGLSTTICQGDQDAFTEVSGNGYERLEIHSDIYEWMWEGNSEFGAQEGSITNRFEKAFNVSTGNWGNIREIGLFDAEENGNLWFSILLSDGFLNIPTRRHLFFNSTAFDIINNNQEI